MNRRLLNNTTRSPTQQLKSSPSGVKLVKHGIRFSVIVTVLWNRELHINSKYEHLPPRINITIPFSALQLSLVWLKSNLERTVNNGNPFSVWQTRTTRLLLLVWRFPSFYYSVVLQPSSWWDEKDGATEVQLPDVWAKPSMEIIEVRMACHCRTEWKQRKWVTLFWCLICHSYTVSLVKQEASQVERFRRPLSSNGGWLWFPILRRIWLLKACWKRSTVCGSRFTCESTQKPFYKYSPVRSLSI